MEAVAQLYDEYYRAFYDFNSREHTFANAGLFDPPIVPSYDIWTMCSRSGELCDVNEIKENAIDKRLFVLMGHLESIIEVCKKFRNDNQIQYI